MVLRYLRVLWDPASFYERLDGATSRGPTMVVLLLGTVAAVVGLFQFQLFLANTNSDIGLAPTFGAILQEFIVPFVYWTVFGVAFYLLSGYYNGTGYIKTLMLLIGWGFLPQILGRVVDGALTYVAIQNVHGVGRKTVWNQQAVLQAANGELLGMVGNAVMIVALLWSGYIWADAVKEARHIDRRDARIVVGIPLAVLIALRLYQQVQAL